MPAPLILRGVYHLKGYGSMMVRRPVKPLKVFIGMKVPRADPFLEQMADLLVGCICDAGHIPLLAYREIAQRQLVEPEEFMPLVRKWVQASDLLLVLYHPELRGGLIEAGIAYAMSKPIWLIAQADMKVSRSARGLADRQLLYRTSADLMDQLNTALEHLAGPDRSADRFLEESG